MDEWTLSCVDGAYVVGVKLSDIIPSYHIRPLCTSHENRKHVTEGVLIRIPVFFVHCTKHTLFSTIFVVAVLEIALDPIMLSARKGSAHGSVAIMLCATIYLSLLLICMIEIIEDC